MARSAFSLIELLVVLGIVSLAGAMVLSLPRRMQAEESVRAAALELAGVLRQTRERAISSRSIHAVAFNIANAPGSSGRILNNRAGGHWYRVLGPDVHGSTGHWETPRPPLFNRFESGWMGVKVRVDGLSDNPIRHVLDAMQRSWLGEPVHLPARRVRFLALTDQDNGDYRSPGDTYAPTYPRPWFGWWNADSGRLHAWGGYDPGLAMSAQTGPDRQTVRTVAGRTISHSGFFYEGYDGIISGCVQPSDRLVFDDSNGDGVIRTSAGGSQDDLSRRFALWRAGEPRPLINGGWGDFLVLFRPDGTATTDWLRLRHEYARFCSRGPFVDPTGTVADAAPPTGQYPLRHLGPSDMCNRLQCDINAKLTWERLLADHPEASSFARRTGYHYITLAPDAQDDADTFASAGEALRSLTPCYRVAVGIFGDIRVLRVRANDAHGRSLDDTLSGAAWQDKAVTDRHSRRHLLTNAAGAPLGSPVVDVVTAEMLSRRAWWWR